MKIFMGLGALVILVLIIALFVKKDYAVFREVTINKPKQEVFDYVKMLKNQDNYSKWALMDPNSKKTYKGTDGTAGFMSAWDSEVKDLGKGEQEITGLTEGARIDYNLHFIKPMENRAKAAMTTETAGDNQTKVTWTFSGNMAYPMNFMLLFLNMDKLLGKDLETGLDNLKVIMEKK